MVSIYSQVARDHWTRHRPRELAEMTNPETFFLNKGREIETAILAAEETLEETVSAATEYEARAGQIKQIRADATAMVLRDLLPEPEPETEETPELSPEMRDLQALKDAVYDM